MKGVTFWCCDFISLHHIVELEIPAQPGRSMPLCIFTVGLAKSCYAKITPFCTTAQPTLLKMWSFLHHLGLEKLAKTGY